MRYFFDCEFIERGHKHPIELISIGVVSENGREFYAVNRDFKPRHASTWVRENVLPLLPERNPTPPPIGSPRIAAASLAWMPYDRIRERLGAFVAETVTDHRIEFWTYYGAYDYVLLSQLMGGMEGWPSYWPYYAHDLRQFLDERNLQAVSQPDDAPHDALQDARWMRDTFVKYRDRP